MSVELSEPMAAAVRLVTDSPHRAEADLDRARTCLLHYAVCAVLGQELPWSATAVGLARGSAAERTGFGCSVVGLPDVVAPESAILANAVLGQSTLAEDVHPASLVHPGSMVIPAALAAAERNDATEQELLQAIVAGYDVVCSIGTALKTKEFVRRGLRPSGVFGPLGAAAAVGSVWRFDPERMTACLGIAANMGAGLREWATAGTTDIYFQNGIAARNGYLAAVLAEHGATGPATAFDGPSGLANAFAGGEVDWSPVLRAGEAPAAVRAVEYKRYPACSAVQSVLDVAARLAARASFAASSIERVEVLTHAHGKNNPGCDSHGPWQNVGQAQMSNQLGVALALLGRPLTVASYRTGMTDEGAAALAAKVTVVEDERLTAVYPARSGAVVRVFLADGTTVEESAEVANPVSDDEVRDMFAAVMSAALDGSGASWEALRDPDPGRSVHEWTRLLRQASNAAA